MRVAAICLTAGCLMAAATVVSAQDGHRWVVRWKRESWSGLAGKLKVDGREITFLDRGRSEQKSANRSQANQTRAANGQRIKVWDAATGQELLTLLGHPLFVQAGVFSRNGKQVTPESLGVTSVAFSPDGQRLASAGIDQTVKAWDVNTGQESLTLRGHKGSVYCVEFSPDGKRLASASGDWTVKLWDAATGNELLTLKKHKFPVRSVAFSRDGKRLASVSMDATVEIWDTATGQELLTLRHNINSVAFSPDGQRLASASKDQGVKVWDATTGQELLKLTGHIGPVKSVAFSPDGKTLASAGNDQTVRTWDAATGQASLTLKGHTNTVNSVTYSPDGQRLATASDDRAVKVWDTATGQALLTLEGDTASVWSVAFSPDGQRLAAPSASRIEVTRRQSYDPDNLPTLLDGLWIADLSNPAEVHIRLAGAHRTLPHDGMYLSYSAEADVPTLSLSKEQGKNTAWKLVNSNTSSDKRNASKGPGAGPQYIQTEIKRFELESVHRPGWFFTVDEEGYLKLSHGAAPKHAIAVTTETFWDDLNDGK